NEQLIQQALIRVHNGSITENQKTGAIISCHIVKDQIALLLLLQSDDLQLKDYIRLISILRKDRLQQKEANNGTTWIQGGAFQIYKRLPSGRHPAEDYRAAIQLLGRPTSYEDFLNKLEQVYNSYKEEQ
ncbi:31491_t:CDS:2, partial [Racocetra persica]